jgi:hypothetical protein
MEKYDKYKIKNIPTSMEEICYPKNKKYELLPQQKFLAEYLFDNIENLSAISLMAVSIRFLNWPGPPYSLYWRYASQNTQIP